MRFLRNVDDRLCVSVWGRLNLAHTERCDVYELDRPVESLLEYVHVDLDRLSRIDGRRMHHQPVLNIDLRPASRERDLDPSFGARLHGRIPM